MRLFDRQYQLRTLAVILSLALLGLAGPVWAETPMPEIPRGKGDKCVEPTDDMRKNHMNYILHQRDETMHRGIRTSRHSLAECINCHVPKASDASQQVRIGNPEHFCSTCHTFSAVTIDCFQCHADTPSEESANAAVKIDNESVDVADVDISPRALNVVLRREEVK